MFLCCTVPPGATPCQLVCQADKGRIVAVRAPSMTDGTKCISNESPNAVCIQGDCTVSETSKYSLLLDKILFLCSHWVVTTCSILMHVKMFVVYVMEMVVLLLPSVTLQQELVDQVSYLTML